MNGSGALLLAASLVAITLAGCAGPEPTTDPAPATPPLVRDPKDVEPLLSASVHTQTIQENIRVPSFDGKRMDNWVWRPKTETPVPVFINFSPYWSNLAPDARTGGDAFSQYMIEYFVPRGYAVVLSSVRGTGHSEGCFNLGGATEMKDAVAVIDHFAKQPWSTGSIAAGGKSYDGTTPQGAAIQSPAALKAIIPVSGISELYKYTYKGGLPYGGLHGATFNGRYVGQVGWGESAFNPGQPDPSQLNADDACSDFAVITAAGAASAATGDYDAYWQERDYSKTATKAQAALFFIHGLQDWNVKPDHILPWLTQYGGPKKVWLHQWVDDGTGHVYPMREDWNYTMLRFLDHTLKGIDTGLFEEPAVQVEDTDGVWRHEQTWPPAATTDRVFFLANDQLTDASGDRPTASFVDNGIYREYGGSDPHRLTYLSAPLETDLRIAGEPRLELNVRSNAAAGKVAVTLFDVHEGKATVIDWGGLNLRHRDDVRTPKDVQPGTAYDVKVLLFPQDTVVKAGHRLAITLAGNAGNGGGYMSFEEVPTGAQITVKEQGSSRLVLPIQSTASLVLEDPQPLETEDCWAC